MMAKFEEVKPIKAHTEEMRRIVCQFAGLNIKISVDEYKSALLGSLPKNCESLIVTLESLIDN